MSSCSLNAGMETFAPLVIGLINNAVPLRLTHQPDATSNHSHPALLHGRFVVPVFIVNWIEVRAVR